MATLKRIFLLPKNDGMEAYWGVNLNIHAFLTCALVGGECSASRFERFIAAGTAPGTYLVWAVQELIWRPSGPLLQPNFSCLLICCLNKYFKIYHGRSLNFHIRRSQSSFQSTLPTYLWLYNSLLDLGRFLSFLILYTVGRTP
jgi:hypothetical protein